MHDPLADSLSGVVSLAHGNGGRRMRELIDGVFWRHLANPLLDTGSDAAHLPTLSGELLFTTDGYSVQPLEYPGGSIGSLAVHGTVNDLAVSGATPLYLSLSAFIEEGLDLSQLDRIVADLAQAARACNVKIVTGDTKVVRRGEGDGLYLTTSGLGVRSSGVALGLQSIRPGDVVLVSGPVGDHGTAVMLAREQFGLRGDLQSDSASVLPLCQTLLGFSGLRFMRDPTRGGLATVCHEISLATSCSVHLQQSEVPVREPVQAMCDMLGYDPYYLACEGRVVAVVAEAQGDDALAAWRSLPQGKQAAVIGHIATGEPRVILHTPLGGKRVLQELEDDPLPRIC